MSFPMKLSWAAGAQVALGLCLTAAVVSPASAYVVVTVDNRVYDVPTKPEVRGDLVLFQLDGHLVSLRVYEVNITKTNELNYMLDSGAGAVSLTQQLRQLKPGTEGGQILTRPRPLSLRAAQARGGPKSPSETDPAAPPGWPLEAASSGRGRGAGCGAC